MCVYVCVWGGRELVGTKALQQQRKKKKERERKKEKRYVRARGLARVGDGGCV